MSGRLLANCLYCGNARNVMSNVDFKCPDCDGVNVWNGIKYRKELSTKQETISIKDEDGTTYEFEKPEFGCELYAVKISLGTIKIIGACKTLAGWNSCSWTASGIANISNMKGLIPINPKWYEDESNFPALVIFEDDGKLLIEEYPLNTGTTILIENNDLRLATKAEHDSLYCGE